MDNFIKEKGIVLKFKIISAYCLYRPTDNNIIKNQFNNLVSKDAETLAEETVVGVEDKAVKITLGSVWRNSEEMIVHGI